MSKKRIVFIICIILILLAVICAVCFIIPSNKKDNKEKGEKEQIIDVPSTIHSEMGVYQELKDEVDYQYGNFKLLFKADKENDKINVLYNDEVILETDYNHAAKVRVNIYNNIYIIEIEYPMAQFKTMKAFTISDEGKLIEEIAKNTKGDISRIEYYSDVNKIIVYKESNLDEDNKKYTYEVVNNKFKLLTTETDYDEYLTKVESDGDYTYYSFNFDNVLLDEEDSYEFNIGDYKLKYVLTKVDNDIKSYDFYVNDKKIYNDMLDLESIKIKVIGKYLIFTNTFSTSTRSTKLYIYDGLVLKEIYELDGIKGMVANSKSDIIINKNGILIKGSRVNNGPTIVYDGKDYDTYSKDTCESTLNELKDFFIVKQDYLYKYQNGVLSSTPEVSNQYVLKEYVKDEEFCNSATK